MKTDSIWRKIGKVSLFLLKILRWPFAYYGALIGGLYGVAWIFQMIIGKETPVHTVVGENFVVFCAILVGLIFAVSIVTSAFFTETFLVSTGLATGMYLFGSFFLNAPMDWNSENLEYDVLKMYVILVLAVIVFLGDVIVFFTRKILKKRSMRHMMRRT